uniref:Uncharacterized protein n=1 Tax=Suricata suricatta TaxID=37032 RepID=A0A673U460_SURSU
HELSKCFIYSYENRSISGPHMIICSALCALYITYNFSLKIPFQEMNASLKVKDYISVVFKLFITMS